MRVGQPASIRLRTGETLPGKVARIARQSDAATRELEVDVAFDAPPARFAIDQEAEVAIVTGEETGLVVPVSALVRDGAGRQGVLVVADGRASSARSDRRVGPQSRRRARRARGRRAGGRAGRRRQARIARAAVAGPS